MDQVFLILLTAHLVGDFVLQNGRMVERKKASLRVLLLHVILVTVMTALFLGDLRWTILGIVFVSHLAMDYVKPKLNPPRWSTLGVFAIDQLGHLAVLTLLAMYYPDAAEDGVWMKIFVGVEEWYFLALTLICGLILAVPVGGNIIAMITGSLLDESGVKTANRDETEDESSIENENRDEAEKEIDGLKNGGRYIGWLERALVLLLVMMGQPSGVGFLVAAKSILRFGDIKDGHQRKVAEYVIIGTFLSFGWAMLIAVLLVQTLDYWRG